MKSNIKSLHFYIQLHIFCESFIDGTFGDKLAILGYIQLYKQLTPARGYQTCTAGTVWVVRCGAASCWAKRRS